MKSVPQILDDDVPEESEPFLIPDEAPRSSALPLADINKPLPSIHLSSISDPTTPPIVSSDRPTQARRHSSLSRPRSPNAPKTPRTANRVRFDLSSTIVSHDGKLVSESSDMTVGNANGETTTSNGHVTNNKNHRGLAVQTNGVIPASHPVRTWVDDEDHMENQLPNSAQHERLLEGMEAGSVSVALEMDEMDARAGTSLVTGTLEAIKAKSGLRSAFMNMANSIIGAGIIGQPYAFKQAGLLAGIILLIGLTIIVDWTIRLIVINSKLSGADSFQATVEHCFGKAGLIAISLAQWLFAFGGMVAFCVIVGDTIPHVFTAVFPKLTQTPVLWLLSDRRFVIILLILGISYPLSLYRDIAKLAKASTLALISMLVILVTVVTQGFRVDSELRGNIRGSLFIQGGIFQAIGVISFAFVCHHNSLLIYGSLRKPTIDRFAKVTHYSTSISMVACLVMALAGFLTFGDKTKGNVLNNFPSDNIMVNIARFCFGLNMLTTLPLETLVCRTVLETYFFPNHPPSTQRHVILTTGLVLSSVLISLMTCDLGAVFEIIGATSACALAYILPPLCYIKLSRRSWKTAVAWVVMVFGTGVLVVSVILGIGRLVGASNSGGGGKTCG